jgi:hypothetical protein
VFAEIPENASLCNYKTVADYYKKTKAKPSDRDCNPGELAQPMDVKTRSGREPDGRHRSETDHSAPEGRRHSRAKSHDPLRPAWSSELYSLEARQMGHLPSVGTNRAGREPNHSHDARREERSTSREDEDPQRRRLLTAQDEENRDRPNAGTNGPASSCRCDIADLYDLAGARRLHQPGTDPEDRLYTFPGTLSRHENVFYDYAIVIPVECVDDA